MPFENNVEVKVFVDGEFKKTISTGKQFSELEDDILLLKFGQETEITYKVGEEVKTPDQVYYLLRNR